MIYIGNAILRGQTGGASPTVISQKKLTLLADVTIYSARTSVDFTGLNVGADTELLLVSNIVNGGTASTYALYVNGNQNSTNYYYQSLAAYGTSIAASRTTDAIFAYLPAYEKSLIQSRLKVTNNGYFVHQPQCTRQYGGSGVMIDDVCSTSTFTVSSITQLTILANSNQIGIGSRFQLYSLNTGGEKTWVTS